MGITISGFQSHIVVYGSIEQSDHYTDKILQGIAWSNGHQVFHSRFEVTRKIAGKNNSLGSSKTPGEASRLTRGQRQGIGILVFHSRRLTHHLRMFNLLLGIAD